MNNSEMLKNLIGLTTEEAVTFCEQHNLIYRLSKYNGKPLVLTRDYKTDRVNVEVENNIITQYFLG